MISSSGSSFTNQMFSSKSIDLKLDDIIGQMISNAAYVVSKQISSHNINKIETSIKIFDSIDSLMVHITKLWTKIRINFGTNSQNTGYSPWSNQLTFFHKQIDDQDHLTVVYRIHNLSEIELNKIVPIFELGPNPDSILKTSIKCYTDASFDPISRTAICGWRIGSNEIRTFDISETNNTRAEIIGIINLVENLEKDVSYIIYTDCMGVIDRLNSKEDLISSNFCNKNGHRLNNADLYEKLFEILTPNISFEHIDGHLPSSKMNSDNKLFSELDKLVRKKLRTKLKVKLNSNKNKE